MEGEVQSPYLPGTKVRYAWDSTCIGAFKTCPRYYYYSIVVGWQPKSESIHLRFGQEYHTALQEYDILRAQGEPHEDSMSQVVAKAMARTSDWFPNNDSKAGRYKNRVTLIGLVVDYLDHFRDDPAETYIRADGTPAVELSFRFELPYGPQKAEWRSLDSGGNRESGFDTHYLLCGHLDRVVDFNGQLLVMDHKTTTTTISDYYFAQYEPNNQMSLYTLAGNVVLNEPIRGVMVRAAQVLLEKPNAFTTGFTYRTPDQIDEWLGDLSIHLAHAEACAVADYWPMNDTACDKFGGCRYRGICSKSPQVRDKFLAADFIQLPEDERWNPLKPR